MILWYREGNIYCNITITLLYIYMDWGIQLFCVGLGCFVFLVTVLGLGLAVVRRLLHGKS